MFQINYVSVCICLTFEFEIIFLHESKDDEETFLDWDAVILNAKKFIQPIFSNYLHFAP